MNGIIELPVITSNGKVGEEWLSGSFNVRKDAQELLVSDSFVSTRDVEYKAVVTGGGILSVNSETRFSKLRQNFNRQSGFSEIESEYAPLLLEAIVGGRVSLDYRHLVVLHRPIYVGWGNKKTPKLFVLDTRALALIAMEAWADSLVCIEESAFVLTRV